MEKQLDKIRGFIKKELRESNNNIRLDALYQQLLLEHVFKKPEPLAAMSGWSIAPEFAWWLYQHVIAEQPEKLIELGSGTSTIAIAAALRQNGEGLLLSFEHDLTYLKKTREMLAFCGLESYVRLIHAPLETLELEGDEYRWYSLPYGLIDQLVGAKNLDFLLIDGPPAATNRHARFPAALCLKPYLKDGTTILLDDAARKEEQEILARWQGLMGKPYEYFFLDNVRHGPALFVPSKVQRIESEGPSSDETGISKLINELLSEGLDAPSTDRHAKMKSGLVRIVSEARAKESEILQSLLERAEDTIIKQAQEYHAKFEARAKENGTLQALLAQAEEAIVEQAKDHQAKIDERAKEIRALQSLLEQAERSLIEQEKEYHAQSESRAQEIESLQSLLEQAKDTIIKQEKKYQDQLASAAVMKTDLEQALKNQVAATEAISVELSRLTKRNKLVYRSLVYKLGMALYNQTRSPWRWPKIPFSIFKAMRRHAASGAPAVVEYEPTAVRPKVKKLPPPARQHVAKKSYGLPFGAVHDMCQRALGQRHDALFKTVLRTGSLQARELLVHLASDGKLNVHELARGLEACRDPALSNQGRAVVIGLNLPWAIQLARVMAGQQFKVDDELNALTLLWNLFEIHGSQLKSKRAIEVLGALSVSQGELTKLKEVLKYMDIGSSSGKHLYIDSLHPHFGGSQAEWIEQINTLFLSEGLEPIRLSEGEDFFSRVKGSAVQKIDNGPLVTVIITAWHPTEGLIQAVSSILDQSWQNLEIIIVDDASPLEYRPVFEACKSMDERIRVIHQAVNQGTYVARNTALRAANGTYVTFQDSDDWSHPRRVELQVQALEDNKELISTFSYCLRVSEQLFFSLPDRPAYMKNTSSLMFRRAPVLEKIGFMDTVRKGADTEYHLRMQVVFGDHSSLLINKPLALIRLSSGSLSRNEFRYGWRHPARFVYANTYRYWHEQIRLGNGDGYLDGSVVGRKFPAPLRFHVDQAEARRACYDVVFVGDWRYYGGPQKSMIEEIKALRARGKKVAICSLEAYRFMLATTKDLCKPITELIYQGVVHHVVPDDRIDAALVILRYPPILQWIPHEPLAWTIGHAWIVANQAPHEHDGSDIRYHVADCVRNARTLFGQDPVWVPQGPQVRKAISQLLPKHLMADFDNTGIVDVVDWDIKKSTWRAGLPVIGRYSRDNPMKFPGTVEEMSAAYLAGQKAIVRIMGGAKAVPELFGDPVPSNWELLPYGAMAVEDFLSEIDFFVYFDNATTVEAFGRSILEAIASGVLVILPHRYFDVFGDAAIYCEADQVADVVAGYYADRKRYDQQLARARQQVLEKFSYDAFFNKVCGSLIEREEVLNVGS